ncbi:MAG: DNA cytosine methyltransferase [Phycisphaerales bacterium]|nr:DNA cytosine methyltransferase [Phycisphaerales bacterium]
MALTFASLYCGCGGFDLGFTEAGYRCTGAFDIDPLAIKVHRDNLKSPTTLCDLTSTNPSLGGLRADVLLAGSPCQGFSTVGKRDPHDPRNSLLVLGGRIAVATRPRVFIAENVSGVVAGEQRRFWDALANTLRTAGFRTTDFLCDAQRMGVPQRRRRMVMVAWRRNRDFRFDIPPVTGGGLKSALEFLDGVSNHEPSTLLPNSRSAMIANHIGQGQKLSNVRSGPRSIHTWNIPEVYGRTSRRERHVLETLIRLRRQNRLRSVGDADPVTARAMSLSLGHNVRDTLKSLVRKRYVRYRNGAFDLTHTFNGKYRRLASDAPSPTVDTRFGDPRYFLHPTQHRGLTVREAARIQGFPDSFVFDGPARTQYRLVGNAVPPPMARQIASCIRDAILETP